MITRDDWLKALEDAGLSLPVDDREAVTVTEFACLFTPPMDRTAAARRLVALVSQGKAVRTRKNSPADARGRVYNVTAYRLVTEPKERRRGRNRSR